MSLAGAVDGDAPLRVLFVCTGNICRSPIAEGVAMRLAREAGLDGRIEFDSAGTHGYHVGEIPDWRTRRCASGRGYDLSGLRARQLDVRDFERFDLVLAMDRSHLESMRQLCPASLHPRLAMFMSYAAKGCGDEVPDPYYGNEDGFEAVLDCCEAGVRGVLAALEQSQIRRMQRP